MYRKRTHGKRYSSERIVNVNFRGGGDRFAGNLWGRGKKMRGGFCCKNMTAQKDAGRGRGGVRGEKKKLRAGNMGVGRETRKTFRVKEPKLLRSGK